MINVGDKAPDFHLPASGGKTVSLHDFKGKTIVLYFYPKDMTSGCTKEACAFQEALPALSRKKAVVIGVSADSVLSHEKFAQKNNLRFTLVSDGQKETAKAYGVWKEKSMYGRKYFGIERTTFVLDKRGVVRHIFPKVKVEGHVQELLKVL
ncbi:MAG: thioredoxin-dependent thiol peroxidase [Bacteroidota bacterium]